MDLLYDISDPLKYAKWSVLNGSFMTFHAIGARCQFPLMIFDTDFTFKDKLSH